jgi:beta-galactosidase
MRQTLSLDHGWLFHLGDIAPPLANTHIAAYMANKAGWARGAAKSDYDDSDWRSVDLPHDWSVEGTFSPDNHLDAGFLPRGVAWYRRHFKLDEADRGKYLAIQFDGVATHATVYVNGHLLHRNFCGYTPFTVDIGNVANFGEDNLNVIALRVDATYMEGWWYEGAGIYRHTWLIKDRPLRITEAGIFIRPEWLPEGRWTTHIDVTVRNDSRDAAKCDLELEFIDPTGDEEVSLFLPIDLRPGESGRFATAVELWRPPMLWSIEQPNLYRVRVFIAGEPAGEVSCGYRTIRFDADHGFFLNDEPLKLKGTCNHQDHAGLGVAVPDSIHEFRIRRLKEMGCNAIRCAHNPPAPELLDACDRLGMLVMDENRNFGSSPEHLAQLRSMVVRDRNHPSVILWSVCNEEAIQGTIVAGNIARAMQAEVKRLDPSRPVTAAVSGGILNDGAIGDVIEIMGINYQLPANDAYHAKKPNVPVIAAETHSTFSTRGEYETDPKRFIFASYDDDKAPWGQHAREVWRFVRDRPWLAGCFAWTGFDYRGEPTPHEWPCVNSHFGMLDMCGFPKDAFYLHKAWWTEEPFVHVLPHWNSPQSTTARVRVMTYTNCEAVELFLNGESLGRKEVDPIEMATWMVEYRPGALKAVGYCGGVTAVEGTVETTGPAVALGLEAATRSIPADGEFALPVTVFTTDDHGRRVPTADDSVTFTIDGGAAILGVGNGNPACHEPDKASSRSLFNGLAQVIVQTSATPGTITLTASAKDRRPATLRLTAEPATPGPSVPLAQARYFVTGWRRSPITTDRPDPNQQIAEQDMNSWERIAAGSAATHAQGHAIYRATVRPPKSVQSRGGRIVLHSIAGSAEVYLDGRRVDVRDIRLAPSAAAPTLSVLIAGPGGLTGPVEILVE